MNENENTTKDAQEAAGGPASPERTDVQVEPKNAQEGEQAKRQDQGYAAVAVGTSSPASQLAGVAGRPHLDGPETEAPYKVAQDVQGTPVSGNQVALGHHQSYLANWIADLERFMQTAEHEALSSLEKAHVVIHLSSLRNALVATEERVRLIFNRQTTKS